MQNRCPKWHVQSPMSALNRRIVVALECALIGEFTVYPFGFAEYSKCWIGRSLDRIIISTLEQGVAFVLEGSIVYGHGQLIFSMADPLIQKKKATRKENTEFFLLCPRVHIREKKLLVRFSLVLLTDQPTPSKWLAKNLPCQRSTDSGLRRHTPSAKYE